MQPQKKLMKKDCQRLVLLGTRFTMEMDFYTKRLKQAGIESLVPPKPEREFIHNAIMDELLKEEFKEETKAKFLKIISGFGKEWCTRNSFRMHRNSASNKSGRR